MRILPNFETAIHSVEERLKHQSADVLGARWQSTDVSNKPEMRMKEVLNVSFQVSLGWNENVAVWRNQIKPNLPWADDHFEERVSGDPLNPGVQWVNWPYALSADRFRTEEGGKFSHTYMERYWPKLAGDDEHSTKGHLRGIRYPYGDLNDVVSHLLDDPLSRQAYLPVWFPEDTGVVHGERVPCSLGYHWIQRNGYFHSTYYIRSCDFVRHFRDDLYLTVRLQLWLLQQLRKREAEGVGVEQPGYWEHIKMGMFTFHCVSMHCFVNDWNRLFGGTNGSNK